jgi:2-iminobutanoate/2-iminopropanoate deaminase
MTKRTIPALLCLLTLLAALPTAAQKADPAKKQVLSDKAPKASGPISQGIAAGGFVFCSGQLPVDPATGKIVPGGIEDQTRQVLKNLAAVLEAGGSSLDSVVKCTVLMTDLTEFAAMNKVYAEFFKAPCPARATFQIGALALGARIEIECIGLQR